MFRPTAEADAGTSVPVRVLVVEDDPDHRVLITRALTRHGGPFEVTAVAGAAECTAALREAVYGVVLLDYSLPGTDGLAVLGDLRRRGLEVPVVMITGQGDERIAVAAMKHGATDYVVKTSGYLATIPTVLYKVLKQHELARDNARLYRDTQRALQELQAAQDRLVRVETLRTLGELASGAAHHLNNLLTVVCGRVDLLLARAPASPDRRPLEIIRRAARDGAEVVRRIQEFARTKQLERGTLDLNELVCQVVEMTRARWQDGAQMQGLTMHQLEAGTLPDVLLTDFGMPGMTGGELAMEVKRRWPQVKVALVTGWGVTQVDLVRRESVDFVLSKPLGLEDVSSFFAAVVESSGEVSVR